jgi:CubicO group peptidase (beta-lactamase class C family)
MPTPLPWLAPALTYVPAWLGYQMRASQQPGLVIAVAHDGEIVLEAAFGHADLGSGEALTARHRFRVASHSKSFTAAAMMKLREAGRLKLDDTAGVHVAGLHPDIAAATIAQLLSHTAGILRDGPDAAYWDGRAPFLDEAQLRAELALPPAIEAGTRLKYSNHGFGLAGLVIASITGEPYDAFVQREIVAAAGLAETTPDVPLPSQAPLARGHGGKALLGRRLVFPGDEPTRALAAATGFVSTAADLAKFFSQLAPEAKPSVLTRASRREMIRPQWPDPWSEIRRSYGLGVISGAIEGWDWFGHSGGFQGYVTRTAVVPEHALAVSLLTNAVDGAAQDWVDGVLSILRRFERAGPPSAAAADWTGRWWSVWRAQDLAPMGDKVLIASPGLARPFLDAPELAITGADEAVVSNAGAFHSHGEIVRRLRGADGAVRAIRIAGGLFLPEGALATELVARYGHGGARAR